jgi:hypothetical protein
MEDTVSPLRRQASPTVGTSQTEDADCSADISVALAAPGGTNFGADGFRVASAVSSIPEDEEDDFIAVRVAAASA